ncbi:MAG: OmpA family protein [Victivallales bacterium]|nr:OmpA family protein [Victivallales bacterium]
MKTHNALSFLLPSMILIICTGCSWFDNKVPESDNTIPGPAPDVALEDGGTSKWMDNINVDSMTGVTRDGWKPVAGVTFPAIYFAYDQSVIGSSERYKLQQVGKYLNDNAAFGLIIEGHCDEKGSAEYNRALGERRAIAVRDFLANAGVGADRLKTISYGEDRPAIKAAGTESEHAKNRRANLILARMR